jgi:hypothetical protein
VTMEIVSPRSLFHIKKNPPLFLENCSHSFWQKNSKLIRENKVSLGIKKKYFLILTKASGALKSYIDGVPQVRFISSGSVELVTGGP